MTANSALVVSDLDFDTIRSNLVSFLSSQSRFKDYDFNGSNISVLLDVLAYNTHVNNFYTNMAISEMFLDSAQIRDSVVSRAKELNYTPRSMRSAVAYIDIAIAPNDSPSTITIPRGTVFTSRIQNNIYSFSTADPIIVTSADNYTAKNVAIYEGNYITESFLVDTSIENQRFVMNNSNIDTSSIYVTVQNSTTDTTSSEFIQSVSLLGHTSSSKIYFVQAADKSRYEIVFGDGIIGVAPKNNNVINVSYRSTKGSESNGAGSFTPASSIGGYSTNLITITTVQAAYGGAEAETLSSIKFNAPRHYQTQERAVTLDDYRTILLAQYPDIRAINVYGGESVYPPQYGKVFISIDLSSYDGIPNVLKESIQSFIKDKMPISIESVIEAADYTYVVVDVTALYNLNTSVKTENDIKNIIVQAVKDFNTQYLNDYNKTMRYSRLASAVDTSDPSIVSSNLKTRIMKKISPFLNTEQLFTLDYQNSIVEKSLKSDTFTYNGILSYLTDVGSGSISIVTSTDDLTSTSGKKEIVIKSGIGTIDYTTGIASITVPGLDSYSGSAIKIYASTVANDFSVKNNTVLLIENDDISATVTATRV